MRNPKSRPSKSARSCSRPTSPSMRRLSSSSWLSRPVELTDNTVIEMTTAMITITTRISTRVKPLLRMLRHRLQRGLFRFDRETADVGVGTFAAGFAIAAVGGDIVLTSVRARTGIKIRVAPRVLGNGCQVAVGRIVGDGRVHGLLDQRLQALLGGRSFEIIQTIEVQSRANRADIGLCRRH